MTYPKMTEDQAALMIERGKAAASLLANGAFCSVVDDLTNFHLSALIAAKPGPSGAEAREYHHLLQYALTEICAELKARKDGGEQMEEVLATEDDI